MIKLNLIYLFQHFIFKKTFLIIQGFSCVIMAIFLLKQTFEENKKEGLIQRLKKIYFEGPN